MSAATDGGTHERNDADELGPVDYVVVEFPADRANFSGEMAAELKALVEPGVIRVLDLILLKKELDGSVEGFESHDFGDIDLGGLRELEQSSRCCSPRSIESIGAALAPGSVAAVLVWENVWAAPFGSAVRRSGGQLVASGRIPIQAIAAVIDADEGQRKKEAEMLGRDRAGRPGLLGGRPVARTAAVAGTAAVVTRGVRRRGDRREDRRDDRGDRRDDRRDRR